jgi:hypothetical protein
VASNKVEEDGEGSFCIPGHNTLMTLGAWGNDKRGDIRGPSPSLCG